MNDYIYYCPICRYFSLTKRVQYCFDTKHSRIRRTILDKERLNDIMANKGVGQWLHLDRLTSKELLDLNEIISR